MRRMYFLTQSTDGARRITDELLLDRIPESAIHVVTHTGELPDDLPEATSDQESDFFPALFKGFGLGALTGLAIGLLIAAMSLFGVSTEMLLNTPYLALIVIFGGLMGAFGAAIVGVAVPNPLLERFNRELDNGRILVMANVPRDRVDELRARVQKAAPDAEYCGLEPLKPAFP